MRISSRWFATSQVSSSSCSFRMMSSAVTAVRLAGGIAFSSASPASSCPAMMACTVAGASSVGSQMMRTPPSFRSSPASPAAAAASPLAVNVNVARSYRTDSASAGL